MASIRIWLEATRPKTLPAALCPFMIGTSLAVNDGYFDWRPAIICLMFGLLVQIGTNFANDYLDGIRGTDTEARLGPRRAVASGLIEPHTMKLAAKFILAVAFCFGLFLIPFGGWWLLLVGLVSVLCAWLYTGGPYPLAYHGLGDVFVVLFFGFIAVGCTYYVQSGVISSEALLLGLASGLVVNNILVVNNYRDFEEDRAAAKKTLVVLFGRRFAQFQYLGAASASAAVLIIIALSHHRLWLLLGCLPLLPGLRVGAQIHQMESAHQFGEALKISGMIVAGFGVCVSLALLL